MLYKFQSGSKVEVNLYNSYILRSLFKSVANFLGSCGLVVPFGSAKKHCATAPAIKILLSFQTVIPLNETTGIIEWINNLQPLRAILLKLYKEKQGKNIVRNEEIRSVKFGHSNSGVGFLVLKVA